MQVSLRYAASQAEMARTQFRGEMEPNAHLSFSKELYESLSNRILAKERESQLTIDGLCDQLREVRQESQRFSVCLHKPCFKNQLILRATVGVAPSHSFLVVRPTSAMSFPKGTSFSHEDPLFKRLLTTLLHEQRLPLETLGLNDAGILRCFPRFLWHELEHLPLAVVHVLPHKRLARNRKNSESEHSISDSIGSAVLFGFVSLVGCLYFLCCHTHRYDVFRCLPQWFRVDWSLVEACVGGSFLGCATS